MFDARNSAAEKATVHQLNTEHLPRPRTDPCELICAADADLPVLSPAQEAGEECAYCFTPDPEIRVGTGRRGPVYACPRCAVAEFGYSEGLGWEVRR